MSASDRLSGEIGQIVIHGVARDAVSERRELRRRTQVPADDGRGRRAAFELDHVADNVGRMMLAAGKHHADRVDERHARAVDDDLGRVLEIEAGDEFGDGLGRLDGRRGGGRCRLLRLRHERPCRKSAACQSADKP